MFLTKFTVVMERIVMTRVLFQTILEKNKKKQIVWNYFMFILVEIASPTPSEVFTNRRSSFL